MKTYEEVASLYESPLFGLISRAHQVLIENHSVGKMQVCTLISYKTGGCPENCNYCAQSSAYQTDVKSTKVLTKERVLKLAEEALQRGASRVCIGAAWRSPPMGKAFDELLDILLSLKSKVEVCFTLGMLNQEQAEQLKAHGLYAYNHNLDTSREYYPNVATSRTYDERLATLDLIGELEMSVCTGCILGLGEKRQDRISWLQTLTERKTPPESIPINMLYPVPGTPFASNLKVEIWEMLRVIATSRILFPKAMIRFSAGRLDFSFEEQTLCFFAGVNSVFMGEKYLTVPNQPPEADEELFSLLGLSKRVPYGTA